MIVIDPAANYIFRGKSVRAAHMLSSEPGHPGRIELLLFAAKIGLKPEWLQKRGTPWEHFDLMNSRIDKAIAAGATRIDRYRLVEILRFKRTGEQIRKLRPARPFQAAVNS